jgi:hypothetical protein
MSGDSQRGPSKPKSVSSVGRRLLLRDAVHGARRGARQVRAAVVMGTVSPSPGYALLTSEVPFEVTD